MVLTQDDVARIAKLARIAVEDVDVNATCTQLNAIFDMIKTMQVINTHGVEPMAHPQDKALRLREDRVTETDRRESFQQSAPCVENGLYLVPKVIE